MTRTRSPSRPRAIVAVAVAVACACAHVAPAVAHARKTPKNAAAQGPRTDGEKPMDLTHEKGAIKAELAAKLGPAERARIDRGVDQVASFWRTSDGDGAAFASFVRDNFAPQGPRLDGIFARLEYAFEQVDGHFLEVGRELKRPTDLDVGPVLPVDSLLASLDASAHLTEDLFATQVAFVALLNFPLTTLAERASDGPKYSRRQWAEVRLAGRFARRVPAEVAQEVARAGAAADLYIAQYNIWMHHLLDEKQQRLFPRGLRLISHWNLRDELKADYADPGPSGLAKQRLIVKLMERIVTQTIPAAVIDNPHLDWNPYTNAVTESPAAEVEEGAPRRDARATVEREADVRYARLLAQYRAARRADPFSPTLPTAIARSFELSREIPEERVKALLEAVLTSPLVGKVAALAERKLGRKLEPQDIWFNGFQSRARWSEAELDEKTRKKYPNAQAFAADIPRILTALGFPIDRAHHVASHIVVDAARGAGHAMPAARRGDFPHLRTRIEKDGMNYKGYNIAVHELGHNVEQVFSLYDVDHTLLAGVPNSAFTEALAFVFQARDLELLGLAKPDAESERLRVLNDFWSTWEIAGVSLVDIAAWHWMYDHPEATPAELREAVLRIARETWNRYYAPVLGAKDSPLLGIYSHMIAYPIYLCDYPLGHLIAFQIEEHLRQASGVSLGREFERMAKEGSVMPDVWMQNATGAPVEAGPLLRATEAALAAGGAAK